MVNEPLGLGGRS